MRPPVTPTASRTSALPASVDACRDSIARARRSLADEARRLERLGFELPLARCHEEQRYWNVLAAVFALPGCEAQQGKGGPSWPDARAA
jgi:hypothetical protein